MLDILALRDLPQQEKLADMSIHSEIKRRREALGWSHQRLADAVSAAEKLAKPLAWQTVQQWENGVSAPKRTRMPFVAEALGCSMLQLMTEEEEVTAVAPQQVAVRTPSARSAPSKLVPSRTAVAAKRREAK